MRPDVNASMNRGIRPIRVVRRKAVLDWIEMNIVHASREGAIIADRVLQVPPRPSAAFARLVDAR
jgi:hypothetical protein